MSREKQNPRPLEPKKSDYRRLIEMLADGNPIPDTSTICRDRQQLISLLAEISKGERSEVFANAGELTEQRGLSAQEIASRAAFLLACLDTPGADDPYTIIGVDPTATSEEIKEAWLSRLSFYHPDRHPENSDWFTRQAARLNEAYQILKDPARRHAYDERRRREVFARQQSPPFVIQTDSGIPPRIPSPTLHLTRHRAPMLITVVALAACGLVLVALSNHPPAGSQLYLEPIQPTGTIHLPSPTPINRSQGQRHITLASQTFRSSNIPAVRRNPSDPPVRDVHTDNRTVSERTVADPPLLAQALPPMAPEPKTLDRQEIDALLDEYVDAYEKGDTDRLMATLSPKVKEKGTLDFQAIRNAYIRGFTGRDQIIYRLKNLQVEIKGDHATVIAQYLISARNAAAAAKATTVSGRIEWKIYREGDKAKIVSINY